MKSFPRLARLSVPDVCRSLLFPNAGTYIDNFLKFKHRTRCTTRAASTQFPPRFHPPPARFRHAFRFSLNPQILNFDRSAKCFPRFSRGYFAAVLTQRCSHDPRYLRRKYIFIKLLFILYPSDSVRFCDRNPFSLTFNFQQLSLRNLPPFFYCSLCIKVSSRLAKSRKSRRFLFFRGCFAVAS